MPSSFFIVIYPNEEKEGSEAYACKKKYQVKECEEYTGS